MLSSSSARRGGRRGVNRELMDPELRNRVGGVFDMADSWLWEVLSGLPLGLKVFGLWAHHTEEVGMRY